MPSMNCSEKIWRHCKETHLQISFKAKISSYKTTHVYPWNPAKKRLELFHRDSRFIVVIPDGGKLEADLTAFSMFRFDTEENVEGRDELIVYWYVKSMFRLSFALLTAILSDLATRCKWLKKLKDLESVNGW